MGLSPMDVFKKVEEDESLLDPANWVDSFPRLGLGETKPAHYREMLEVLLENADELPFAWRILKDGVCDGCALGTSGMEDWTLPGIHLCSVRLKLLRMNTMGAVDSSLLEDPVALRSHSSRELREQGRLAHPMVWRDGTGGYERIGWDAAMELLAQRVKTTVRRDPDRMSFYLTSRGIPNETYYAFQKVARFLGTNNVDTSARICHSPSTSGLKRTVGDGATNCSYRDWVGTDLLLLVGTNLANNQPVSMKYIYHAKKAGTRVVVVNPYREEGLERYWVPSSLESALFGTRIMDDFYQVKQGGDAAFFNGALKHLVETEQLDQKFIEGSTRGFGGVRDQLDSTSWDYLEKHAGCDADTIREFADQYASVDTSVTVWSMGITQHSYGQQNVFALSNLALSQGRVGREKCGLNPIRGHSGVQGGAEMGATPTQFGKGLPVEDPEARNRVEEEWGFECPAEPGLSATGAIEAMQAGDVDLLYSVGGNFLETLPQPDYVKSALEKVPVRVFQDIVINPMMLLEPGELNLVLPGATRYETPGGVTETTTERRVIFSPEIPGRRIGEARPEWRMPVELARRVKPDGAGAVAFESTAEIREDIARTIPAYEPIDRLEEKGDQFQWGGERLYEDGRFNTEDGRAHFQPATVHEDERPGDRFTVTTRRGKQFNSMIWGDHDASTSSDREDVFISEQDAAAASLGDGDPVLLRSDHGEMRGRLRVTDRMKPGNLQVHWPEGEVLIEEGITDPSCGIPEYDAVCELIPLEE